MLICSRSVNFRELLNFQSEHVHAAFELDDTSLERFLRDASGLLQQQVNARAGHFGNAPKPLFETQFPAPMVLFGREAKTDHSSS
jgi:hypothetical protein